LLVEEEVVVDEMHDAHGLGASRGLEQVVEAECTVLAVLLWQDGWGRFDSWSAVYDDTHEGCAVVVTMGVEVDALTCIAAIHSRSWSNYLVFW
jgi:hypothetical protein